MTKRTPDFGPLFAAPTPEVKPAELPWEQRRAMLDLVMERIRVFEEGRNVPHTKEYNARAKGQILRMLEELDATAPATAKRDSALAGMRSALASNRSEKMNVEPVVDEVKAMRGRVLPPRPAFNPADDRALLKIDGRPQMQFLQRLVDSAHEERTKHRGEWMFRHLPSLNRMVDAIAVVPAYYQLGDDILGVLKRYENHHAQWRNHVDRGCKEISLLVDDFEARFPGPHTQEPLVSVIPALRTVRAAGEVHQLYATLHNSALDFFFGDAARPSFLKRLDGSYRYDKSPIDLQRKTATARNEVFHNPLMAKSEFLDAVADARWLRAADQVRKLLTSYKGVLGSGEIEPDYELRSSFAAKVSSKRQTPRTGRER